MRFLKRKPSPAERPSRDLFVGLHIHKTAGMTLLQQFRDQLGSDRYYSNSMYAANFRRGEKELEERFPHELGNIRVIYGHAVSQYMLTYFKDRNVKLFTFLREPVSRIISWYCYHRKLLTRLDQGAPDFTRFYNSFFPQGQLCSMLIRAFPAFIDSRDDPPFLQAISILKKFHFVSTLDDFSARTPALFDDIGLSFEEKTRKNVTDYTRELDFKGEVDYDFLREDNRDDIQLYEAVQSMNDSAALNCFGFDAAGYERAMIKMSARFINPFEKLLMNHQGPIKRNYKLENIYNEALAVYERLWAENLTHPTLSERQSINLLIKLYALEENPAKKKAYHQLLKERNRTYGLQLAQCWQPIGGNKGRKVSVDA